MAVTPVALGIVAPFSGTLSDRIGSRPVTVAGLLVLLTGYLAASTLSATTPLLGYVLRLSTCGLGHGHLSVAQQ